MLGAVVLELRIRQYTAEEENAVQHLNRGFFHIGQVRSADD